MRLQMLVPDGDVAVIRKLDTATKEHLLAKTNKFKEAGRAKMILAAQRNDQAKIAAYNKEALELDVKRMYLTTTNIIRAAIALGLKEMNKLHPDQVIELTRKHGVSRGRPNGG